MSSYNSNYDIIEIRIKGKLFRITSWINNIDYNNYVYSFNYNIVPLNIWAKLWYLFNKDFELSYESWLYPDKDDALMKKRPMLSLAVRRLERWILKKKS